MIDQTLLIITQEINQFLRLKFDLNEDKVLLSALVDQDGNIATQDENKIIFTLIDISEETTLRNVTDKRSLGNRPNLHLNLKVLFSACFNSSNYIESLKYITAVISFFHAKPVFNISNSPGLGSTNVEKIIFDLFHQDSNAKNNLWATIGAKYLPSVVYNLRMLTISDTSIKQQIDRVSSVDIDSYINPN